jgi:hypothetical protein
MIGPRNKRERSRLHSLVLLFALAGLFLSSGANILDLSVRPDSFALNGAEVAARLSLNDSAVGRIEKRISNSESKRYRRQMLFAPPSARSELALLSIRARWSSAFQDEPSYSVAAISPPTDRAPPTIAF